jgi:DNA replication and repair protein RecF
MKKTLMFNNDRLRAASDLIGRAPVVVLTPDDKIITSGPPAERRRFMNVVLSQASRTYLEHELGFKKALKHRNVILSDAKQSRRSMNDLRTVLEPWTEMVIHHASRVIERRNQFTKDFRPYLIEAYALVSEHREQPSIAYEPMGLSAKLIESGAEHFLRSQLEIVQRDEFRRGVSLVGAHRDDLMLYLNGTSPMRDHASQGQHKTLLVAMKLAEFRYLKEASGETPMLLLDDVFSELDQTRAGKLLELAESGDFGQTFITSTDRAIFERSLSFGKRIGNDASSDHRLFEVTDGTIQPFS